MAKKTVKKKAARKPNAAFMKPVTPSAMLAEVVGPKPAPRTEMTKKLWLYIKVLQKLAGIPDRGKKSGRRKAPAGRGGEADAP